MIEKVEFHNFKGLRDVSLDLERFTVLVGPNASGKTSVLEGLYYLAEVGRERSKDAFPSWRISPDERTCGVEDEVRLEGRGEAGDRFVVLGRENISISTTTANAKSQRGLDLSAYLRGAKFPMEGPPDFGPAALLRLEVRRLAAASYSDQPVPRMESDGHGLPSALAYLPAHEPETYERILAALRSVIPMVEGMRFRRTKVTRPETEIIKIDGKEFTHRSDRPYWGEFIEFDMGGATRIPALMASEGTLLVLGLLTVLMGPDAPRLVLLDDLDRALHPKAQEQVVALLRELLARNPEMQIVATSHSPYLLHHLQPEEVRLTVLKADGSVVCGRLGDHPQFEKWKEEMTPGEMWSLFGEKWLVEAEAGGRQ